MYRYIYICKYICIYICRIFSNHLNNIVIVFKDALYAVQIFEQLDCNGRVARGVFDTSKSKSLSQIIRRRYGDKIIKRLRKFEKIDYRLRKAELDLEFLVKCRDNNVIPKFLNFRLANRSLGFSLTYAHCQSNLLLEEIRLKKSNVRVLKKEFDNLRSSLRQQINSIDFAHICSKFLKINDLKLKSNSVV